MTDRMRDVDQTHPETNRAFGLAVFGRGPVADGGRTQPDEQMYEVDQETPGVRDRRWFQRGTDDHDHGTDGDERNIDDRGTDGDERDIDDRGTDGDERDIDDHGTDGDERDIDDHGTDGHERGNDE